MTDLFTDGPFAGMLPGNGIFLCLAKEPTFVPDDNIVNDAPYDFGLASSSAPSVLWDMALNKGVIVLIARMQRTNDSFPA